MERMLELNNCDMIVFNPTFGSDISPHNKVPFTNFAYSIIFL